MAEPETTPVNLDEYFEQRSYLEIVERQFRRNNLAMWGLRVVVFLVLVAIFSPFLASNKPLLFHGYRYKLYLETYDQLVYAHADLAGLGRGGKPTVVPGLFPEGKSLPGIAEAYRTEQAIWESKNPTWKMIRDVSFGDANDPLNKLRKDLEESIPALENDAEWARGSRDVQYLEKQTLTADLKVALQDQIKMARANLERAYALRTGARRKAVFQQLQILRREVSREDRKAIDGFRARYKTLITPDLHRKTDAELEPFDVLLRDMRKRLNPKDAVVFEASTSSPALRQLGWLDLFFLPFVVLWALRLFWSWPLGWYGLGRWVRLRRQFLTSLIVAVCASALWGAYVPTFNDATDYKKGMTDGSLFCSWRVMAPIPYGLNENNSADKYKAPWWWFHKPGTDSPSLAIGSSNKKQLQAPTIALAWSPNGGTLAAATAASEVRLLNPRTGLETAALEGRSLAWSPGGAFLAISGRKDHSVLIVDDQGKTVVTYAAPDAKGGQALSWSHDGRYLAAAIDNTIRVFDVDDEGDTTGVGLEGHTKPVTSVTWSPSGALASAAEKEIRLWNVKAKSSTAQLSKHAGAVTQLAWSPDGAILASAATDTTIRLWGSDGKELRVLKGHLGPVNSIAWAPNGRLLASGSHRRVGLWSPHEEDPLWLLKGHKAAVMTVAWSGDGSHLASVDRTEEARLWTVQQREWLCKTVLTTVSPTLRATTKKDLKKLNPNDLYGAITLALKAKIGGFKDLEARAVRSIEAIEAEGKVKPNAEASRRKALFEKGDPVELAKWARTAGLRTEARRLLEQIKPGQPGADLADQTLGPSKTSETQPLPVPLVWSGGDGKQLATGSWDATVLVWKAKDAGPAPVVPGAKGALKQTLTSLAHDVKALRAPAAPATEYERFLEKLSRHHMGTDGTGRDLLTRMIWGSRISLSIGFVAVGIYVFIGIVLGALAGFFGGWTDIIISRIIEIVICFPAFFLILTVIAFVGPSVFNIMVVIGITRWTGVARLVRGEFLRLRSQDFVVAGKALGYSNTRIIFRHVLPNALAPVLVAATFGVASAILIESSLSFLGFGVTVPTPTWGSILSSARESWIYWWITLFPGFAIFLTVTMYNLVGEGVRDAVDPKMRQ